MCSRLAASYEYRALPCLPTATSCLAFDKLERCFPVSAPCVCAVSEPFDDPDYLFELKYDGFRAIAYIENAGCRLVSRNLKNLRFASLKHALAELPVKDAILCGEIICIDRNVVSQFNQLLSRKSEPILYKFDLLWLNGQDLRPLPPVERKRRLSALPPSA